MEVNVPESNLDEADNFIGAFFTPKYQLFFSFFFKKIHAVGIQ